MYINAILPKNYIDIITEKIYQSNTDLDLSNRFFNYPLHISLKRTFYIDDYESIKQDVLNIVNENNDLIIDKLYPFISKDMLWLRINDDYSFKYLHNKIDKLLFDKYQIPIDEFDRNYVAHITLFKDSDIDKLNTLYERIQTFHLDNIHIDEYATGIVSLKNEFYKKEKR